MNVIKTRYVILRGLNKWDILNAWVDVFTSEKINTVVSCFTSCNLYVIGQNLKCDGTRAETRFRLLAKRTRPHKLAGASVQSTTGSQGMRISSSNAGYIMFWGSVKSTGYPLHSPVSPSLPPLCVTVCHDISTGLYHQFREIYHLHLQRISTLRSDKKYVPLSFSSTQHLNKTLLHVVKESYRHHKIYSIYHIEEFWAFDWNEVDSCFISYSFSKQCFATAGRTTKQYTWRSRNSQLSKVFRIPYRSLESKQNHHIPITKSRWNINSTILRNG